MPMYLFKCSDPDCKEETMFICEVEDRDNTPEEKCKCGAPLGKRKMCAATIQKAPGFGSKGNWLVLLIPLIDAATSMFSVT